MKLSHEVKNSVLTILCKSFWKDKESNGENLVTIVPMAKRLRVHQLCSFPQKIFSFHQRVVNSFYLRDPLKIFGYIEKSFFRKGFTEIIPPVHRMPTLVGDFFFITCPDIVKKILHYPRLESGEILSEGRQLLTIAAALGKIRLNTEKSDIKDKRSVLGDLVAKPQKYLSEMFKITNQFLDSWKNKPDSILIAEDIAKYTVEIFLKPIMHYKGPIDPIVAILEEQIDLLGKHLSYRAPRNFHSRFEELRKLLATYLASKDCEIDNHSVTKYDSQLNAYVEKKHKDKTLEAREIGINGATLAGYLAPNPTFNAVVYELGKYQSWQNSIAEEWEKMSALGTTEEEYIDSDNTLLHAVIHEIIRLHPAQPFLFRKAATDFVINNEYFVSRKSDIIVDLYHLLRRPSLWGEDAEVFNPLRFIERPELLHRPFLAYSTGPNNCLGQSYSRQSLKIFTHLLCKNFRWETMSYDIQHRFHFALHFNQDILIRLEPRVKVN